MDRDRELDIEIAIWRGSSFQLRVSFAIHQSGTSLLLALARDIGHTSPGFVFTIHNNVQLLFQLIPGSRF